jgi:hypothetical protein
VGGGFVAVHLFGHGHGHKGKHKKKDHNSGKLQRSPDLKATDEAKESSNG